MIVCICSSFLCAIEHTLYMLCSRMLCRTARCKPFPLVTHTQLTCGHPINGRAPALAPTRRALWAALADQLGYLWLIPLYRRLVAAHAAHPSELKGMPYGSPAGHTVDVYLPSPLAQSYAVHPGGVDGDVGMGDGGSIGGDDDINNDDSGSTHHVKTDCGSNVPSGPPVAIFVHGGAWEHGGKELYATLGQALAARGFVTVVIDHTKFNDGSRLGKACVFNHACCCVSVPLMVTTSAANSP